MLKWPVIKWIILGFLAATILVKTFPLKTLAYDSIPKVGETFDEYAFAWAGSGLLHGGKPVGWSTNLGAYKTNSVTGKINKFNLISEFGPSKNRAIVDSITFDYGLGDRNIDLVQPYFDHPPLAGIVYALGVPKSANSLLQISASQFRFPNRFVSLVTALLVFLLAYELYGSLIGIISLALYSTIPSIVLSGRLSLAENVLAPLIILNIYLILLAHKHKKLWLWPVAGLVAGLTMLTKFSGVSAFISGISMLMYFKASKKEFLRYIIPATLIGAFYPIFGLLTSPSVFMQVMLNQAARANTSILDFFHQLSRIYFLDFPLDGWWLGGLMVLLYIAKEIKNLPLIVTAFSYILVAILLGGDFNAWYFFPLGVFYVLAYGSLFAEILDKPSVLNLILFTLFPLLSSLYWGFARYHQHLNISLPLRLTLLASVVWGYFGAKIIKKHPSAKNIWRVTFVLLIGIVCIWNFYSTRYLLSNWGKLRFPQVWNKNI